MRKTIFFTFTICSLFFGICHAQWQPDVRLTNDTNFSNTSYNNSKSVAAYNNTVHIAWIDSRNAYRQVFYKRSIDGGLSWSADTQLTSNTWYYTGEPGITVSGSNVHIVWIYNHNADWIVYYKHSSDGGQSWAAARQLGNFVASYPSITSEGQNVVVAFGSNNGIYCARSLDGGLTWTTTQLTNTAGASWRPSVSLSGSFIHIAWQDNRDGNYEIYYKRSSDVGVTWSADTRITNTVGISDRVTISSSANLVNISWEDSLSPGTRALNYKRSTDAGITWQQEIQLGSGGAFGVTPSLVTSGQKVHLIWSHHALYYINSADGGVTWSSLLTLVPDLVSNPSISLSGTALHVVWADFRNNNSELYYKRNPTGNVIGINVISSEVPNQFSLSQNYPNPFNPTTKIRFQVARTPLTPLSQRGDNVRLVVFDVLGREVATLVNEQLQSGTYEADWNAAQFASGVYYYKLLEGDFVETKKMVLIK